MTQRPEIVPVREMLPWQKEDTTIRRCDYSAEVYRALCCDMTRGEPDLKTARLRSVYRPELDFHMRQPWERLVIVSTHGPDEDRFDIYSSKTGLSIWGFAETFSEAAQRIAYIRKTNPNASLYNIRVVSNLTTLYLPLPKSQIEIQANQEHEARAKTLHMAKTGVEADDIENRMKSAKQFEISKADAIARMNTVREYLDDTTEFSLEALRIMKEDAAAFHISNGTRPIDKVPDSEQAMNDPSLLPTIDARLASTFLRFLWDPSNLPHGYTVAYERCSLPDGKILLQAVYTTKRVPKPAFVHTKPSHPTDVR